MKAAFYFAALLTLAALCGGGCARTPGGQPRIVADEASALESVAWLGSSEAQDLNLPHPPDPSTVEQVATPGEEPELLVLTYSNSCPPAIDVSSGRDSSGRVSVFVDISLGESVEGCDDILEPWVLRIVTSIPSSDTGLVLSDSR